MDRAACSKYVSSFALARSLENPSWPRAHPSKRQPTSRELVVILLQKILALKYPPNLNSFPQLSVCGYTNDSALMERSGEEGFFPWVTQLEHTMVKEGGGEEDKYVGKRPASLKYPFENVK